MDDHEPFRRFVFDTLREQPNLQIIAEAEDGIEAVQRAQAFLDIGLPGLNGTSVLAE